MVTTKKRKDFINFIADASGKPKLMEEFLSKKTPEALYEFFQEINYLEIHSNDCVDILGAMERVEWLRDPQRDRYRRPWCPGPKMSY